MRRSIYRGYEYGQSETIVGAYAVFDLAGKCLKDKLAHEDAAMDWIDAERRRLYRESRT